MNKKVYEQFSHASGSIMDDDKTSFMNFWKDNTLVQSLVKNLKCHKIPFVTRRNFCRQSRKSSYIPMIKLQRGSTKGMRELWSTAM